MYDAMPKNVRGSGFCLSMVVLAALVTACRANPQVPEEPPQIPEAQAEITGDDVEQVMMGDAGVPGEYTAPYDGEPVEVTLDGSGSNDRDGNIVTYRWLSGTADPQGGRLIPEGEDDDWPADERRAQVELEEGVWLFSLWVIDDEGLVSDASTVTITVGDPQPPMMGGGDAGADEGVQACIDAAFDGISDACKECTCSVSPECQMAIAACDETCWGLISCAVENCDSGDTACIGAMCGPFLSAAAQATAAGTPCAGPCTEMCTPAE